MSVTIKQIEQLARWSHHNYYPGNVWLDFDPKEEFMRCDTFEEQKAFVENFTNFRVTWVSPYIITDDEGDITGETEFGKLILQSSLDVQLDQVMGIRHRHFRTARTCSSLEERDSIFQVLVLELIERLTRDAYKAMKP